KPLPEPSPLGHLPLLSGFGCGIQTASPFGAYLPCIDVIVIPVLPDIGTECNATREHFRGVRCRHLQTVSTARVHIVLHTSVLRVRRNIHEPEVGSRRLFLRGVMVDRPQVCIFCARQQNVSMTTREW